VRVLVAVLAALALAGGAGAEREARPDMPEIGQISKDSVWVPTPERMIRRLLQLADTTKDDVVLDLGSGDGRIPIYAAKQFGARGIGVELEENLVSLAGRTAAAQGVTQRVQFIQDDLFKADLSVASVIALYISPGVMERLKPRLLELKPGTRVVSHHFTLGDWEHDEKIEVEGRSGYLWVVPAALEGDWKVSLREEDFRLRIERHYQKLATSGLRGGKQLHVIGARLRGTELWFTSFDRNGATRHFHGRLESDPRGDRLVGSSEGWPGIEPLRWTAVRTPG
jgi:SAM-dependent methyltransferase